MIWFGKASGCWRFSVSKIGFAAILFAFSFSTAKPGGADTSNVNGILQAYARALGGEAALEAIKTREIDAKFHRGPKATYYWAKPDKVLRISRGEKAGFDGNSGWILSRKKKLGRLPKPEQQRIEMNADPVRYVHAKDLYSEIDAAPRERVNDQEMDVLVAPNNIGSTKFYFDTASHLLVRIEELGVTSAYYKQVTEFLDYKEADGIRFPFRIVHTSTEPGGNNQDIRISKVQQNIDLKPQIFAKPQLGNVTLGGKR